MPGVADVWVPRICWQMCFVGVPVVASWIFAVLATTSLFLGDFGFRCFQLRKYHHVIITELALAKLIKVGGWESGEGARFSATFFGLALGGGCSESGFALCQQHPASASCESSEALSEKGGGGRSTWYDTTTTVF